MSRGLVFLLSIAIEAAVAAIQVETSAASIYSAVFCVANKPPSSIRRPRSGRTTDRRGVCKLKHRMVVRAGDLRQQDDLRGGWDRRRNFFCPCGEDLFLPGSERRIGEQGAAKRLDVCGCVRAGVGVRQRVSGGGWR